MDFLDLTQRGCFVHTTYKIVTFSLLKIQNIGNK